MALLFPDDPGVVPKEVIGTGDEPMPTPGASNVDEMVPRRDFEKKLANEDEFLDCELDSACALRASILCLETTNRASTGVLGASAGDASTDPVMIWPCSEPAEELWRDEPGAAYGMDALSAGNGEELAPGACSCGCSLIRRVSEDICRKGGESKINKNPLIST